MKKQLLILNLAVCLIMLYSSVSAQVIFRPYFGLNSSSLTEDLLANSEFQSNMGYQFGADFQIGNKIYVQPGIQFEALKNTQTYSSGSSTNSEFDLTRSYMRIPVMLGYNFGSADQAFGFRLFTGPNAAFILGEKVSVGDGSVDNVQIEDIINSTIWGWNIGVGLDLISILFVDAGYQFGLSEVFKETEDINSGARNNLFYVNAGLRVRF